MMEDVIAAPGKPWHTLPIWWYVAGGTFLLWGIGMIVLRWFGDGALTLGTGLMLWGIGRNYEKEHLTNSVLVIAGIGIAVAGLVILRW